jgi:hypothetical protein
MSVFVPASPSASMEVDPQMASALLAALADHPLTFDLSETQRHELVAFAMREQKFNDMPWLETQVVRIKAGIPLGDERSLGQSPPAGKPQAEIPVSRPVLVHDREGLEGILEAHRDWIRAVLEPGKDLSPGRANLKGNDLRGYNLEGVDLRAANLEGCDLSGCSLIGANLAGANLSRSKLVGASLNQARLRRANLSGADLSGASLRGADLRQAQLQGAKLEGADVDQTVLAGPQNASSTSEA